MNCGACGHTNREGRRFCGGCGARLLRVCPSCGVVDEDGDRFCGGCGAEVEPARATSPVERSPRDYTPNHLADEILRTRSAIQGERKQVTVLFVDIRRSLALSDDLDAEDWHVVLDRFFRILTDGIHRYEGTVNQYTGDGCMALFGAPIAHEDHPQRAGYTALHLRDELRRYSEELRLERGLDVQFRMGVNSGEVVVGRIGDDLRMDYTAQGATVGLAQRMEQLAGAGCIYAGEATARRIAGYFALRDLGPTRVKGLADPVRVFELEGAGEHKSRFDVSRARGLSRFVGREREMAQLEERLEQVLREGRAQVVGIVAPAGTGKSRLTFEFGERCRARGLEVMSASCPPHGRSTPLAFHMEATRSLFGLDDGDDPEAARNKVAAYLSRQSPDLAGGIPFMFDFLGIQEPGTEALALTPEARQGRLLEIVRELVEVRAEQPLVALFEDLHWIDPASQAVESDLHDLERDDPFFTLLNYRPEYDCPYAGDDNFSEIRLEPLTEKATAELLGALLGPEASGRGLEERIQARAAGNPFFAEEIVQCLAESGHLEGRPGAYRIPEPIEALEVPDSVRGVLEARIDRLGEREKGVLQSAAVIGRSFAIPLLQRLVESPSEDLDAALHALRRAEFVREIALHPEREYAFVHPLTQEVAYASQLGETRRRLHGALARALMEVYADRADERASLLAYHWERAGEALQAARAHARTARWAETRDLAAAADHWQTAHRLCGGLERSEEGVRLEVEACERLLHYSFHQLSLSSGEHEELLAHGLELADGLDDSRPRAMLRLSSGMARLGVGDYAGSLRIARSVADELAPDADPMLHENALSRVASCYYLLGNPRTALQISNDLYEAYGQHDPDDPNQAFRRWLMLAVRPACLHQLGRSAEAEPLAIEALRVARQTDIAEIRVQLAATMTLIPLHLRFCRAEPMDRPDVLVPLARSVASRRLVANALLVAGHWYVLHGEPEAAMAALDESEAINREHGFAVGASLGWVARLVLAAGHPERALELCEEAVRMPYVDQCRLETAERYLTTAGALLQTTGTRDRARVEAAIASAQAIVDETGAIAYQPLVHRARADWLEALGESGAAEAERQTAERLVAAAYA